MRSSRRWPRLSSVPSSKSEKPRKYKNVPTVVNGITFDSKREAHRYRQLLILQDGGAITELEIQPKFPLEIDGKPVLIRSKGYPNGRRASYTADFRYRDELGEIRVEDTKGYDTPASRLRRAVVECIYSIRIELI